MSVDTRIREGLIMIEKELPTVDTVEGYQNLERDIRRDARRRRVLIGAAAVAALVVATGAVLLSRDGADKVQPAPRPDRPQQMAMFGEGGAITYVHADGTEQTLAIKQVDRFAVSPDERQIAYITYRKTNALWVADADGTHRHRIPDACHGCQPGYGVTWSHDGTRLAYAEFTPGKAPTQLRIRTVATGAEQVLALPRDVDARAPMFSPDDRTLAVNAGGTSVATLDPAEGISSWTRVSGSYRQVQMPTWSTDGRTIYYTATTHGTDVNDTSASIDLFAVGADGSDLRQITHATRGERYFGVSQIGDRFLISRGEGDAPWMIGWLSADGATFTPITDQDGKPLLGNRPQLVR